MAKSFSWFLAVALGCLGLWNRTVSGDEGAETAAAGWSATKPAEGPFVEVDVSSWFPTKSHCQEPKSLSK